MKKSIVVGLLLGSIIIALLVFLNYTKQQIIISSEVMIFTSLEVENSVPAVNSISSGTIVNFEGQNFIMMAKHGIDKQANYISFQVGITSFKKKN